MRPWLIISLFTVGCTVGAETATPGLSGFASETGDGTGMTYAIHIGGVCSTSFTGSKGGGELGQWDGVISVDAAVDQRENMAQATSDLEAILDEHCVGGDWCYLFTYSNSGATLSRVLSISDTEYNIVWALNAASNEGGSELGGTGWIGEVFGGCTLTGHIGTSDHRSGWNHNDTGGATFYMLGGYKAMAPWVQSAVLPGEDDGAVAFHSSGGYNDTYRETSLCGSRDEHYAFHETAFTCDGYDKHHMEMKMQGVVETGGN